MLPISLTIEGLYSYQTRQTINFSELTEAGLFGIFGAVGSGKSSILEAITFALYAETERMNSKDSRAYNMMNLRSNRSYIEFEFQNFENRKFRVCREFRRNTKRFEDVKLANSVFYEEKNEQWIPLEHTNAEKLLGLSYDNFKRTIIIPQGQFKEFLELGATERTRMMKEIFGLQKYDLQDKVSAKISENKYKLAELDGKLGTFEDVSEELIHQKKEELSSSKSNFEVHKRQHQELEKQFQQLKKLKEDADLLQSKEAELNIKQSEEEKIKNLEQQLEVFEYAERHFQALLTEKKRLANELSQNYKNQESVKGEFEKLSNNLSQIRRQISELEKDFSNLDNSRQKASDLSQISKILVYSNQKEKLLERITKGEIAINESRKKENEIQKNWDIESQLISELKSKKIDTKLLMDVENWFQSNKNLQAELAKIQEKIWAKSEEITEQQNLLEQFPENWKVNFAEKILALTQKKIELQNRKSHLELSQKLSEFAQNIESGKPCPLCGSTEHPHILEAENVSESIININDEIKKNEQETDLLKEKDLQVDKILEMKQLLEKQKNELANQKLEIEKKIQIHIGDFTWDNFDQNNASNFQTQKNHALESEKTITVAEKKLEDIRKLLDHQQKESKRFEEAILDFSHKKISLETSISDLKQSLKVLDFAEFADQNAETLHQESEALSNKNENVENQYQQLQKDLLEIVPQVASKETLLNQMTLQVEELNKSAKENTENLDLALTNSDFKDIAEAEQILSQDFDIPARRKEIQNFRIAFSTLKEIIATLRHQLKEANYQAADFAKKEEEFLVSQQSILKSEKQLAVLESQFSELAKSFETKKELLTEQNQLLLRKANLDILFNLFKAAGFVNYVSSIYLKQLCDNANIRFHRMTRNQLSLQVNDKNEFEIIDYLNEGKTRSVKTLSGGQSFQVSLSLALALAESVQSQAKSDKNFFFIDEGFGTQDPESVSLVFETLTNLQKENRIVGIISHVEELKEKIPISLNIKKNEETGSQIEVVLN